MRNIICLFLSWLIKRLLANKGSKSLNLNHPLSIFVFALSNDSPLALSKAFLCYKDKTLPPFQDTEYFILCLENRLLCLQTFELIILFHFTLIPLNLLCTQHLQNWQDEINAYKLSLNRMRKLAFNWNLSSFFTTNHHFCLCLWKWVLSGHLDLISLDSASTTMINKKGFKTKS